MGNIYLTSDLHFCHDREFCYGPRGFSSVEEMNDAIVTNYNNIVTDDDIVYILGDCMLNNNTKGIELLSSLKGHKYIALGNHDTTVRVEKYLPYVEDVQVGYRFRHKKIEFWLTHYPMIMKNFTDPKPVWNLSGHTHGKDKFENGKYNIYNVALDAHDNKPVLLDDIVYEIRKYMAQEREKEANKLADGSFGVKLLKDKVETANHFLRHCEKCIEYPYYCNGYKDCPPGLKYRRDPPDGGYYG